MFLVDQHSGVGSADVEWRPTMPGSHEPLGNDRSRMTTGTRAETPSTRSLAGSLKKVFILVSTVPMLEEEKPLTNPSKVHMNLLNCWRMLSCSYEETGKTLPSASGL